LCPITPVEPNDVDTPLIPFPDRVVDVPSTASPPPALVYAMHGMATLQRLALSGCTLDAAAVSPGRRSKRRGGRWKSP
jgi:hypothetical protein